MEQSLLGAKQQRGYPGGTIIMYVAWVRHIVGKKRLMEQICTFMLGTHTDVSKKSCSSLVVKHMSAFMLRKCAKVMFATVHAPVSVTCIWYYRLGCVEKEVACLKLVVRSCLHWQDHTQIIQWVSSYSYVEVKYLQWWCLYWAVHHHGFSFPLLLPNTGPDSHSGTLGPYKFCAHVFI